MAAMCAIGNPEGFETMLASLGVYPKLTVFPDHHRYHQRDFQALDPVLPIAVTEKDAVKIQALGLDQKLIDRIYVLVVEANLPESLLTAVDLHVKGFNA